MSQGLRSRVADQRLLVRIPAGHGKAIASAGMSTATLACRQERGGGGVNRREYWKRPALCLCVPPMLPPPDLLMVRLLERRTATRPTACLCAK